MAAIGAVVEAYVPLLGRTTWPAGMRLGNVLELTCDATARAALMVALVGLPAVATLSGRAPDRARDARVPSQELDAAPPSGTS